MLLAVLARITNVFCDETFSVGLVIATVGLSSETHVMTVDAVVEDVVTAEEDDLTARVKCRNPGSNFDGSRVKLRWS